MTKIIQNINDLTCKENNSNKNKNLELIFKVASLQSHKKKKESNFLECFVREKKKKKIYCAK